MGSDPTAMGLPGRMVARGTGVTVAKGHQGDAVVARPLRGPRPPRRLDAEVAVAAPGHSWCRGGSRCVPRLATTTSWPSGVVANPEGSLAVVTATPERPVSKVRPA